MKFGGDHPAHGHGKVSPRCVPEGASDEKNTSSWQYIAAMYSDSANFGKICVLCIQKPRKAPLGNTPREHLATKGRFRRPKPSNHARRANLAAL